VSCSHGHTAAGALLLKAMLPTAVDKHAPAASRPQQRACNAKLLLQSQENADENDDLAHSTSAVLAFTDVSSKASVSKEKSGEMGDRA
jgi:hypothetical protein